MTTTASPATGSATPVIGAGVTRVDGPLKVTGAVPYADDLAPRDALVGVLVGATIASGEVSLVDASEALAAPGVVAVLSHQDAPSVVRPNEASADDRAPRPPFQDATVSGVKVDGDTATASLVAGGHTEEVTLERQDDDWLLTKAPGT